MTDQAQQLFEDRCQQGLDSLGNVADDQKHLFFGVTKTKDLCIFPMIAPTQDAARALLDKCAKYKTITANESATTHAMHNIVGLDNIIGALSAPRVSAGAPGAASDDDHDDARGECVGSACSNRRPAIANAFIALGKWIYAGVEIIVFSLSRIWRWLCPDQDKLPEEKNIAPGSGPRVRVKLTVRWTSKQVAVDPIQTAPAPAPAPAPTLAPVPVITIVYPQDALEDVTYAQFIAMNEDNRVTIVQALMAVTPPFESVQFGSHDQVFGRDNTECTICFMEHNDETRIVYRHRQLNPDGGYTYLMLTCTKCFVENFTFCLKRYIRVQIQQQAAAGDRVLSKEFVEEHIARRNIACPGYGLVDRVYEESHQHESRPIASHQPEPSLDGPCQVESTHSRCKMLHVKSSLN